MYYSIFRNNTLVTRCKPDSNSELSQKKQLEDTIRLNFTLDSYVEIKVGDYIKFDKNEQFYFLNKNPRVIESPKNYQYECIFEGPIHELNKTKVFLDTEKSGGGYYRDYKFSLSGNAQTFLDFIVQNLNRNGGSYVSGAYKSTGTTNIEFNNWTVFEAINEIADVLEFDWYLDGDTLNFDSKPSNNNYIFQVGRKNGFEQLTRLRIDRDKIETVVYAYGSTENLPPRTAESGQTYDSNLLSENRLSFVGEDGESKLSNNTDKYGIIESVQEFDIKPEFTGTISSIDSEDNRIFYDTSIDFDINDQLLSGITPKITFLTGKLIGLTFNISFVESTNEITIDYYEDESGQYPNSLIYAEIGDTYKLFDIAMPDAYIIEAKTRLQEAAQNYLDQYSKARETYTGVIDREYIQNHDIVLELGDIVRIISNVFGIDDYYDIKELKQNIFDPYKYSITFGDSLPLGLIQSLKITDFVTKNTVYNVQKNTVTNNQVTNIIGDDLEWQPL